MYCALNFKNEVSPIIIHHELEKKLYGFYSIPEFRRIFQDICPKEDYINPENSYLDLVKVFNMTQLVGLLIPTNGVGEISSVVSCDENIAQQIISNYDEEITNEMSSLLNTVHNIQELKLIKSKSEENKLSK